MTHNIQGTREIFNEISTERKFYTGETDDASMLNFFVLGGLSKLRVGPGGSVLSYHPRVRLVRQNGPQLRL